MLFIKAAKHSKLAVVLEHDKRQHTEEKKKKDLQAILNDSSHNVNSTVHYLCQC